MACPSVTENHGLDQGGPTEIVDVIERRAGRDQRAHDGVVSKVGSRDESGPVVSTGNGPRIAAQIDRQLYHARIVLDSSNGDHVVVITLQRIGVATGLGECLHGIIAR